MFRLMKRIITFFLILLFFSGSFAQQISEIDFAEAASSLSIDLDKMPSNPGKVFIGGYFDLIKLVNQKDLIFKFEKSIKPFLSKLSKTMHNNNGQLIKVRIYVDEFGNNYLPENFFLPFGVGMDPIDAYSEYLNTPALSEEIKTSARDASYYLWVFKENNKISVGWIPRELNEKLMRSANMVAMIKVKGDVRIYHPLNASFPNYLSRANYWNQTVREYSGRLNSLSRLEESQRLSERFNKLQEEHSKLVVQYEHLSNKLANNNTFLQTAEILVNLASNVNDINSSMGSGNATKGDNITYDPKLISDKSVYLEREVKLIKTGIDKSSDELSDVEKSLKRITRDIM